MGDTSYSCTVHGGDGRPGLGSHGNGHVGIPLLSALNPSRIANTLLGWAGLRVVRAPPSVWPIGTAARGVATLIDVGCAYGTPQFYGVNDEARLFLIDPVEEYTPHIRAVLRRRAGGYAITAVGARRGEVLMNVEAVDPEKSSILARTDLTATGGRLDRRRVPVTPLDSIVAQHGLQPPFGIKIDTEGYEMEVVRGASETLSRTSFLIAEVSVQERFEGGYRLIEFLDQMRAHGFEAGNVLSARPDRRGLVRFMDMLFVRPSA